MQKPHFATSPLKLTLSLFDHYGHRIRYKKLEKPNLSFLEKTDSRQTQNRETLKHRYKDKQAEAERQASRETGRQIHTKTDL